ncbi:MAG: penicillin-binding protein family [Clostridia bacterium]|jgi:penicillin-binding protein 1A|nr:penicillin-binding protein family [Clostridia bacterium]
MKKFLSGILFIIIFTTLVVSTVVCIYMVGTYKKGVDISNIELNAIPHIYDSKGNEISVIYDNETRVYTKLSEVPKYVYTSFIAIEDKRFYEHHGFDVKRFSGAVINYVFNKNLVGRGGGSTITQQLARNITEDNEDTPKRKMREIARAIYLEKNMSKDEILENYINYIYFGQGAYGINAASLVFFGKIPSKLSVAESAAIAAMAYSPEGNNPYSSDDSKKRLLDRQKLVLKEMKEQGYISKSEYDEALKQDIVFKTIKDTAVNQYVRIAIKEAKEMLISSGLREDEAEIEKSILNGNIQIYTNLNVDYQNELYKTMKSYFKDDIEASFIITTKDGKIISAISSRTNSQYDRIKIMTRQPGSTMKPIAVYAPAFDMGILTPNSIVTDSKVVIKSGNNTWSPSNWYEGYRGDFRVYDAIGQSINTIAVKTLDLVGISKSMTYLKNFGITSLTKQDAVYPLAIGGITNGISPFEMVRAYNVFNNEGMFRNISFIDKIIVDGKTIKISQDKYKVISEDANDMIDDTLRYVVTNGTASKANISGLEVRAKTGTTDDKKDFWLCGYTDDVTATLWVGYDKPKSMNFSSGEVATLWSKLVSKYYK